MRYKTNDTTRNTYTGKARALGGGWYGARAWPRDEGARARFALTVALRLCSNATYTAATNDRGGIGGSKTPTLYLPTGPVQAAAMDTAELDRASDLVAAFGMLAGAVKSGDVGSGFIHGVPSEHGYGRTWNPLPQATNAATLAKSYRMDARATTERADLRPWQVALSKKALDFLASQWLAEAEDSTLAPLERARRARIAALRSPQTVRDQCSKDGATIGTDALGAALAAYALACVDNGDDADGARAFAEFATTNDRNEEDEDARNTAHDEQEYGNLSADTNKQTRAREALEAAYREQRSREIDEEERTPEHEREQFEEVEQDAPTHKDARANKAGRNEDHAADAIDAAAEAIHAPTSSAPVDERGRRQIVPQNRPPMQCEMQEHKTKNGAVQTYAIMRDGKGEASVVVTPFRRKHEGNK